MFAGIALRQPPVTLGSLKDIYGTIAPDDKVFWRYPSSGNYNMKPYGNKKATGDLIGLLLEFNDEGFAKLTLFKNGKLLGCPFTRIKPGTYYPCISLAGGRNVVTIEPNA